jgi:hypothetical protein
MKPSILVGAISSLVLLVAPKAQAYALPPDPWFISVSAGHASLDHDVINVPTGEKIGRTKDSTNSFYSVEAGVRLHKYLEASAAWNDYGDSFHGSFSTTRSIYTPEGYYFLDILTPYRVSVRGFSGTLIPRLPITERISLFTKLGVEWWDMNFQYVDYTGQPVNRRETISGHNLLLGAGIEFAVTRHWSAHLQYEHLTLDMDSYSLGLSFRF